MIIKRGILMIHIHTHVYTVRIYTIVANYKGKSGVAHLKIIGTYKALAAQHFIKPIIR